MAELASSRPAPLFGTDGMRGAPGVYPLDRDTVTRLGRLLAAGLAGGASPPLLVLGGDTRSSTPAICGWLASGIEAGGGVHRFAGPVPTPAVSFLVRSLGGAAGIAVSASHNPWPDNGIKLFDRQGRKASRETEHGLEEALVRSLDEEGAELLEGPLAPPQAPSISSGPGPAVDAELAPAYLAALRRQLAERGFGERPLDGLEVVLDCAHGAASSHAAELFASLGAAVDERFAQPDGRNINHECGSTHPEALAVAVPAAGAALGFAFDGDADRAIAVDAGGRVRDGDALLYLWARHLHRRGELRPARVVATSMSNLGLARALEREGIELVRCDVGDRAVAETMARQGIVLGGEQSGHLIDSRLGPTGDGLQTAIHVAAVVAASGGGLADLLAGFRRFPQVLLNVRVARQPELASLPRVAATARHIEERLAGRGRLVLRYSGTEPLARVMIEGEDGAEIDALARELAQLLEEELG
jgi:phosphoglucosamine mutase